MRIELKDAINLDCLRGNLNLVVNHTLFSKQSKYIVNQSKGLSSSCFDYEMNERYRSLLPNRAYTCTFIGQQVSLCRSFKWTHHLQSQYNIQSQ